jgi:uncharacterized membrane protein
VVLIVADELKTPPFPPVHTTELAEPPNEPVKFTKLVVEQIVRSAPAFAVGVALTETVLVIDVQPVVASVKVKVTLPIDNPVAKPVAGITDAILGVLDTQVPPVEADNCKVLPTHKVLPADKVGIV